jgi:cytochrome-b5 reductase
MIVLHHFRRRILPASIPFFVNMNCCLATTPDASKAKECTLPSSLTSAPIKSIIGPGECQFNDEFTAVPLLENTPVSSTSFVLRFGLPDTEKGLGLSTCACLLAGASVEEGEDMVIRPYTPISTNEDKGTFDLLVKKYADGKMSSYLSNLKPSSTPIVSFKHIPFNVKIQYPFKKAKHILMIAGGTGITPMIQALHAIIGEDPKDRSTEKVTLLYGSQKADDILGKDMLDHWSATHEDVFSVTHVLSNEDGDVSNMKDMKKGFVSKEIIAESFPGPDEDVLIFICGPPPMYNALCGPRDQSELSGVLAEMGYSAEQVFKF